MKKRSLAAIAATVLTTMGLAVAPQAAASPNALVAFGDSVMSNPAIPEWINAKAMGSSGSSGSAGTGNRTNCPTDPNGFAKHAAWQQGLTPHDYSCTGASVFSGGVSLAQQVDWAMQDGHLDGGTREVLLNFGFNDTYGPLLNGASEQWIRDTYINIAAGQVDRIRSAAPNAEIKIVGYPAITNGHAVCLLQLGNNIRTYEPLPIIVQSENLIQSMQSGLAARTGTKFVDVRAASRGHEMCAPDGQRWYGAIFDFGESINLPIHMTARGMTEVGGVIARA
ncbi:GDSL-type esterase/lipase family protein [Corynebacterium sp. A21]|uniref:GDSL-type esterase/lipase family protein n=1 Tax=Corynebacterium sp. A21 TaxID=3457318 RepID=UPI003FD07841